MIAVRFIVKAVVGLLAAAVMLAGVGVAPALASTAVSPWWSVSTGSRPTELLPGSRGQVVVWAQNRGDASTSGGVSIVDVLPKGVQVIGTPKANAGGTGFAERGPVVCKKKLESDASTVVTCTFGEYVNGTGEVVQESLPPYEMIEVQIQVRVSAEASEEETSTVSVNGGGALRAATGTHRLVLGEEEEKFGFEEYTLVPEEAGGQLDTQAGSHPFQLTSVVALNQRAIVHEAGGANAPESAGLPKNIVSELPVGMFGNPTPFAQCSDAQFAKKPEGAKTEFLTNECPAAAAIGIATIQFNSPGTGGFTTSTVPIFNVTPRVGEPARFGFKAAGIVSAYLDASVQTGGTYAISVGSYQITEVASILNVRLSFWGVPGDKRHDHQRGWECLDDFGSCPVSSATAPPPFLVMPTSCGEFRSTLLGESWGSFENPTQTDLATYVMPEQVDGCNHLPFDPSLAVTPDIPNASSPTGLTVDVHVPQEAALNPEGLAQSTLKDTTVALPAGVALNPAGADGLESCAESEIGFTGVEEGGFDRDLFTGGLPEPFCPDASKVGTVTIRTPLLAHALEGAVYLATQNQNPFGSVIAMYLVAQDPVSGTLIKVAGEVKPDPVTGQIVTTFKNTPELPFEDLELHFFGGERAPLGTPSRCGAYTTSASFAPWSGSEAATPASTFHVTSGPNGTSCPGVSLPFSPSLTAGMTSIQAGGFSPFTMTMSREDGQQSLQAVGLHMPPGFSGLLAGVELCQEPQADQGLCGPNSLVGETTVSVGLGGEPFSVKGGRVYITGPYRGAPFGLSIVNPAKAGPFDLENTPANHPPCDCIVVRAKVEVDPTTAQLIVTSDNEGPYKIPTIIEGIPLQIKHVNVTVNRPGFTFNPTNCNPMAITGNLSSTEGATSGLSVPFQATNCATLGFAPKFAVTTSGKTSKANGASLNVKLTYPKAMFGSQANIKSVKVDLPKQLPSRLTTLQKACTAKVFEANPAGCPAASFIGHAKAVTPLLPVPLEGPAIFVSHGGEAFPSLIIVLQGYGVTLNLVGSTFISKTGITSSTFKTVPDAPVGSFELNLPEGKFSALAANGNLCTSKLAMPTEFLAQNGMKISESTPVSVTGCAKTKALTRAQKLAVALKACKKKAKQKRAACNTAARRKYGSLAKKTKGKGKA